MVTSPIVCLFSDPPFFVVRPQPYYQRQPTQSVTMPCVAEGDPKPALTWRKVRHPHPHPHPPYTHTPLTSPKCTPSHYAINLIYRATQH